jgi:hypothetical protein
MSGHVLDAIAIRPFPKNFEFADMVEERLCTNVCDIYMILLTVADYQFTYLAGIAVTDSSFTKLRP